MRLVILGLPLIVLLEHLLVWLRCSRMLYDDGLSPVMWLRGG